MSNSAARDTGSPSPSTPGASPGGRGPGVGQDAVAGSPGLAPFQSAVQPGRRRRRRRHTWAGREGPGALSVLDREQVVGLLDGLEVVRLDEVEEDGRSSVGPKHWHRFEVVARRPVVVGA